MESLKRHSLLSLIFILNFFSKTSVIRNVNLSSYYRVEIFRSLFFLFVILSFFFVKEGQTAGNLLGRSFDAINFCVILIQNRL